MGFVQQQTLTLVHRGGGETGGGRDSPGELGRGKESCVEGRETRWGASAEVLAPREAHWRPPGKKGLVLAEERGMSREFTPRPRPH